MTTHVFVVDESTFKFHLEYLFAGTGGTSLDPSFLVSLKEQVSISEEKTIMGMLADCSRARVGDYVVFYLRSQGGNDGRFFGIFKVISEPFLDLGGKSQFLHNSGLSKNLPFRVCIEPFKVYSKGVTEWRALDDIQGLTSPNQMIWSLIYRKLRGNRGNTMITIYESKRLLHLIALENSDKCLKGKRFDFNAKSREIVTSTINNKYSGTRKKIDVLPRLIQKASNHNAHEAHLQAYISRMLEKNHSLVNALDLDPSRITWLGNEVSCGVGMQKIDVVIQEKKDEVTSVLYVIELKDELIKPANFFQVSKYIKWVEQYYYPNLHCFIQPVLICRKPKRRNVRRTKSVDCARKVFDQDDLHELA